MTNLLAAVVVTLVTNTTEVTPTILVPDVCPESIANPGYGCLVAHMKAVPDPSAKEKKVVTTCEEVTTLRFDWMGAAREVVNKRTMWQTNVVLKLDWVPGESKVPTTPFYTR